MRFVLDAQAESHGYGHLIVSVGAYTLRIRLVPSPHNGIDIQLSSRRFTKRTPYWFWRFPWTKKQETS